MRGSHWSPVNFPHKGQWPGALIFSLICVGTNAWVNDRNAGDLRRHCAHYGVTVMFFRHHGVHCDVIGMNFKISNTTKSVLEFGRQLQMKPTYSRKCWTCKCKYYQIFYTFRVKRYIHIWSMLKHNSNHSVSLVAVFHWLAETPHHAVASTSDAHVVWRFNALFANRSPLYRHGLSLIPTWISNRMLCETFHPFSNSTPMKFRNK